ncbi:hypothetical protein RDI58_014864 [Solanum bulbocastanum]|uniref:Uncharacterized protein n=1 Tax=Solanum bulbocastanum TaxID=147425 RepID=A0AAN8YAZ0_SOLBU
MSPFSINNDNTATNMPKSDLVIVMDQLNDFSSRILELCKNKDKSITSCLVSDHIQSVLMNFLSVTPNDFDRASEHLELFISSSVPKSLIMKQVKVSLCILIAKFAQESEKYDWLF